MKRTLKVAFFLTLTSAVLVSQSRLLAQSSRTPEVALRAAQHIEEVEGDLRAAIDAYALLARGDDRVVAARALLRMAECYQKLGDAAESAKHFERVLQEFDDQTESAATARARLAALAQGGSETPSTSGSAQETDTGITVRQVWSGPEVNAYGGPSPDGRFLTFTDFDTPALAIRDLTTGETRRLVDGTWGDPPEFQSGPSRFSPDGRQVMSVWLNERGWFDLRVVPVDAEGADSAPRVVYSNREVPYPYLAGWSPDGESVLATFGRGDGNYQVAIVSLPDGSATVLKSFDWRLPGNPGFSPDGRYIAYDFPPDQDADERDIFVLAADGSWEGTLIQHPANDQLLGWTPDGENILFRSDRTGTQDAWLIGVAEGRPRGQPRLVRRDVGGIKPMGFTRDGSFYYGLDAGIRDIYVATVDPASGTVLEQPRLASQRFLGANRGPAWSPDGEQLAYFVNWPRRLFVRSSETGQERELTAALQPNLNVPPRWSPDGRWLLVNSTGGRGRRGLYRVNVETGAIDEVLRDVRWGVWTTDGESIIYAGQSTEEASPALRIRNLETGEDSELFRPEEPMGLSNLALSPDGRRLAFGMSTLSTIIGQVITVLPLDGGQPHELLRVTVEEGQFNGLEWAPDGTHLFFARAGRMWRIPADGGEPRPIAGLQPNGSDGFSVHPDGRRIAFLSGESKAEVWVMENFLPTPGGRQ